jgi:N-carbamoyl-L-amino-acid hydrolase
MIGSLLDLRIDAGRFRANFEALATIGGTPDGGVHRPAFGEAHLEARRWYLETAEQAGLEGSVDGAGNHSALLRCGPPNAPTLLLGSHLDSVPYGGRFDGALGVIAALEVLQTVNDHGLSLDTHLEAIDFTDEEGRYANFVGSLGLTGRLEAAHLQAPRGGREQFQDALHRAGLSEESLFISARDPATLAAYLELHIEQGGRLAGQKTSIGVVTGIVGIRSFRVRFLGRADHAGTTPMEQRSDAAQGACAFTLAVRDTMLAGFPACVATVGNMVFEPGVFNVVPEVVTVSLEFRSDRQANLDAMEAALRQEALGAARRFGLDLEIRPLDSTAPARMHDRVQQAVRGACERLGLSHTSLASGAGHDAQCLAAVCPTGMIFVPSVAGRSHSPREFTGWQDCVNGANVLLHAALTLARSRPAERARPSQGFF